MGSLGGWCEVEEKVKVDKSMGNVVHSFCIAGDWSMVIA
jgi:hypothetical protein